MNSRYVFKQRIGQGSYGQVYLAIDTQTQSEVAIKRTLLPALAEKEGARLHRQLHHEQIAKYIDSFEDQQYFYIVMTYIPGNSLANYKHQLKNQEIKQLAKTLFSILNEMWQKGMLYGDLKPSNILYTKDTFYLIDFGSLRLRNSTTKRFGSPAFASSEYLNGAICDWKSDVYSMAKTLDYLYAKPPVTWKWWYYKMTKQDALKRFKTLHSAYFYLFHYPKITLGYFGICLLLGVGYYPIRSYCYESCIRNQHFYEAIAISPSSYQAYKSIIVKSDIKDDAMWLELENLGLLEVKSEEFLWDCVLLLTKNYTKPCWELQEKILSQLQNPQAIHRCALFKDKDLEAFNQVAKTNDERYFMYAFALAYFENLSLEDKVFLWTELQEETQLDNTTKLNIMATYAILQHDQQWLNEVLQRYLKLDGYAYEKARLYYALFQNGNYQSGYLAKAIQLLENEQQDEKSKQLYQMIEEEIKQWGENA